MIGQDGMNTDQTYTEYGLKYNICEEIWGGARLEVRIQNGAEQDKGDLYNYVR